MKLDIQDCICVVNLCQATPLLQLMPVDEFISKHFADDDSTDFVHQCREKHKGAMIGAAVSHGTSTDGKRFITMMVYGGSLSGMQADFTEQFVKNPEMLDNPQKRKALLKKIDEVADGLDPELFHILASI